MLIYYENLLTGKGFVRAGSGHPLYENKKGKGIVRAGTGHPSFRFNGVFSRNNLPKK